MSRPITIHNGGKDVLWLTYGRREVGSTDCLRLDVGASWFLPDAAEVLSIGTTEPGRDDIDQPD